MEGGWVKKGQLLIVNYISDLSNRQSFNYKLFVNVTLLFFSHCSLCLVEALTFSGNHQK